MKYIVPIVFVIAGCYIKEKDFAIGCFCAAVLTTPMETKI